MAGALPALRQEDGKHLVPAEEDSRGKNQLYRWRPE
jgi:hypothetical protein